MCLLLQCDIVMLICVGTLSTQRVVAVAVVVYVGSSKSLECVAFAPYRFTKNTHIKTGIQIYRFRATTLAYSKSVRCVCWAGM